MIKIVLAESNQDTRFLLGRALNDAGYEVESLTGATTIVGGKVGCPDIFILDQDIPIINGFAVSRFLRMKEDTKRVPIIMLSNYPGLKEKARKAGVSDFLLKPFATKQLLNIIEKHVEMKL